MGSGADRPEKPGHAAEETSVHLPQGLTTSGEDDAFIADHQVNDDLPHHSDRSCHTNNLRKVVEGSTQQAYLE